MSSHVLTRVHLPAPEKGQFILSYKPKIKGGKTKLFPYERCIFNLS